jgi:hypothetical protein
MPVIIRASETILISFRKYHIAPRKYDIHAIKETLLGMVHIPWKVLMSNFTAFIVRMNMYVIVNTLYIKVITYNNNNN